MPNENEKQPYFVRGSCSWFVFMFVVRVRGTSTITEHEHAYLKGLALAVARDPVDAHPYG